MSSKVGGSPRGSIGGLAAAVGHVVPARLGKPEAVEHIGVEVARVANRGSALCEAEIEEVSLGQDRTAEQHVHLGRCRRGRTGRP